MSSTSIQPSQHLPKVSIITVCLNSARTIADTIESVRRQNYPHIEHIIVDGGSTDGTLDVVARYREHIAVLISERDAGIYDAMNKGIRIASGEIIGTLNADDMYADSDAVAAVVDKFKTADVDVVFADLVVVDREQGERVVRYYRSEMFEPSRFAYGWMPAHPTVFVRQICFTRCGSYRTDYRIAADYELLVRFLGRCHFRYSYLDRVTVKMRRGGVSTRSILSNWIISQEIVRACRENGIKTNLFKVLLKYPRKLTERFRRPVKQGSLKD